MWAFHNDEIYLSNNVHSYVISPTRHQISRKALLTHWTSWDSWYPPIFVSRPVEPIWVVWIIPIGCCRGHKLDLEAIILLVEKARYAHYLLMSFQGICAMIFSDDGLVGWWGAYLNGAWYGCYRGRGAFFSIYATKVWLIHHVMNFVAHSSKEKNLSIEEITEGHIHGRSKDQGGDEERRHRSPRLVLWYQDIQITGSIFTYSKCR